MPVPNTVEEVLMARIDRLAEGAKSVLPMGPSSAVSSAVSYWRACGAPRREVYGRSRCPYQCRTPLCAWIAAADNYLFKHALTQEVAYRSLLTAQRRALHHRVAVTLETFFSDRLEEYYGQLAHHYCEAAQEDDAVKAVEYAVRAGERHMALPAYAEAVRFYDMALQALERQQPVDDVQRCTLLLALGEAQTKAGDFPQASNTFQRTANIARTLGAL